MRKTVGFKSFGNPTRKKSEHGKPKRPPSGGLFVPALSALPENQQDESRRNNHGSNGENNGEYSPAVCFAGVRGVHLAGLIGGFVHGLLRRGSGAFRLRFRRRLRDCAGRFGRLGGFRGRRGRRGAFCRSRGLHRLRRSGGCRCAGLGRLRRRGWSGRLRYRLTAGLGGRLVRIVFRQGVHHDDLGFGNIIPRARRARNRLEHVGSSCISRRKDNRSGVIVCLFSQRRVNVRHGIGKHKRTASIKRPSF